MAERVRVTRATLALGLLAMLGAAPAGAGSQVSGAERVAGTCRERGDTLTVVDGVAFRGEGPAGFGGDDPQAILTPYRLDHAAAARALFPIADAQLQDQTSVAGHVTISVSDPDTAPPVLVSAFVPTAAPHGLLSPEESQRVHLERSQLDQRRFVARLTIEGGTEQLACDLDFALDFLEAPTLDAALPADGGAPVAAYRAYLAALAGSDLAAIAAHVDPEHRALQMHLAAARDYPQVLDYARGQAPAKLERISGRQGEELADLEIRGINAEGKAVRGTVRMHRVGGRWLLRDEWMQPNFGD